MDKAERQHRQLTQRTLPGVTQHGTLQYNDRQVGETEGQVDGDAGMGREDGLSRVVACVALKPA